MVSIVQRLFFDDLISGEMGSLHWVLARSITYLLLMIKALSSLCGSVPLFSDDEVRLVAVSCVEWVLTNVGHDSLLSFVLFLPLRHIVVCRLVLQPFEDKLVFFGDFH